MKLTKNTILFISMVIFCNCNTNKANDEKQVLTADTVNRENSSTLPAHPSADTAYKEIARAYLQRTYHDDIKNAIIDSGSRLYSITLQDLNDDNIKELFIKHTGPYFCGSGGCTLTLLDHSGNKISVFTVADPEVRISLNLTHGWHDILISSRGTYHLMQFDGKRYPGNPSVQKRIPDSEALRNPLAGNGTDLYTERF